jgi:hypothetical protein
MAIVLHIEKHGNKFHIVDADGLVYGKYDSREDAEAAMHDWQIYFES